MKPLRALVIGAGPASVTMHLPVLARLRDKGEIVLASICDIQPERAASARRKFHFLAETGTAAPEQPDIDVVYVFASAPWHYEYGLRALGAGKHLFVEKPIAPGFAQAREMADLARQKGLVAVGGHNRRFFKSLEAVRARAGKSGWRFAEAIFHKAELGRAPAFGARSWLTANGIHALDALIYMMGGLPAEISALADGTHGFSALMRWQDGAQAVFLCDNKAGGRREEYAFHGAGLSCRVTDAGLAVEENGLVRTTKFDADHDGILAEHAAFLSAIRDGTDPPHVLAALAPSLFLAEQIERGFHGRLGLPGEVPSTALRRKGAPKSILVMAPEGLQAPLARHAGEFRLVSPADVEEAKAPRADIEAVILGRGSNALPPQLLEKLPNLSVVGLAGLSLTRLQPENLLTRNVTLINASSAYAESVAEFALALAILGRRRAFLSHDVMRQGGWGSDPRGFKIALRRMARGLRPFFRTIGLEHPAATAWRKAGALMALPPPGAARDLKGATVGLIGWSANARAFAQRLVSAGAHVRVWSEHASPGEIDIGERVALGEALAADIVSLHRGLTPATHHFLGAADLARLRRGSVLINIARGALIEPDALVARLRQGDIFACLDSYEDEPLARNDALRQLPNVFLTAHIAGGSPDMHAAAAEEVVVKVTELLRGATVQTIPAEKLRNMT